MPDPVALLQKAVFNNDVCELRRLFTGASRAYLQNASSQCLLNAAKYGRHEVTKHLISFGISVNCCDSSSLRSPLLLACNHGHKNVVFELLRNGADVNHQDKKGFTPLMISASSGRSEILQLLLYFGADVSIVRSSDGKRALDLTTNNRIKDILRQYDSQETVSEDVVDLDGFYTLDSCYCYEWDDQNLNCESLVDIPVDFTDSYFVFLTNKNRCIRESSIIEKLPPSTAEYGSNVDREDLSVVVKCSSDSAAVGNELLVAHRLQKSVLRGTDDIPFLVSPYNCEKLIFRFRKCAMKSSRKINETTEVNQHSNQAGVVQHAETELENTGASSEINGVDPSREQSGGQNHQWWYGIILEKGIGDLNCILLDMTKSVYTDKDMCNFFQYIRQKIDFATQVTRAVHLIHDAGLVWLDVKPTNFVAFETTVRSSDQHLNNKVQTAPVSASSTENEESQECRRDDRKGEYSRSTTTTVARSTTTTVAGLTGAHQSKKQRSDTNEKLSCNNSSFTNSPTALSSSPLSPSSSWSRKLLKLKAIDLGGSRDVHSVAPVSELQFTVKFMAPELAHAVRRNEQQRERMSDAHNCIHTSSSGSAHDDGTVLVKNPVTVEIKESLDSWSLGMLLFQLFHPNCRPFFEINESDDDQNTYKQHQQQSPQQKPKSKIPNKITVTTDTSQSEGCHQSEVEAVSVKSTKIILDYLCVPSEELQERINTGIASVVDELRTLLCSLQNEEINVSGGGVPLDTRNDRNASTSNSNSLSFNTRINDYRCNYDHVVATVDIVLRGLLQVDPDSRMTARDALMHLSSIDM